MTFVENMIEFIHKTYIQRPIMDAFYDTLNATFFTSFIQSTFQNEKLVVDEFMAEEIRYTITEFIDLIIAYCATNVIRGETIESIVAKRRKYIVDVTTKPKPFIDDAILSGILKEHNTDVVWSDDAIPALQIALTEYLTKLFFMATSNMVLYGSNIEENRFQLEFHYIKTYTNNLGMGWPLGRTHFRYADDDDEGENSDCDCDEDSDSGSDSDARDLGDYFENDDADADTPNDENIDDLVTRMSKRIKVIV